MVSRPRAFGALLFAVLLLAVCAGLIKIGTDEGRITLQTNAATRPPLSVTPAETRIPTVRATPSPVATIAASVAATPTVASGDIQPSLPLRAAFYYPWYPDAWSQQGIKPYTKYLPALGYYESSDKSIILRHIAAMQYGHIAAGISSWWGKGDKSDSNFASLLGDTAGSTFRWAIYYEPESTSNPSLAQLQSDLQYIRDQYGSDPSYLRLQGRFVVFVYASGEDTCEMSDRWKQANIVNAYIVLKVFADYNSCPSQPDGWHQYAPASATDDQEGYSYSISPGFWKAGEPQARLPRDLSRWYSSVRDMVAEASPLQLITSFNEWGEGTAIEPATEWASGSGFGQYLDALHDNGQGGPEVSAPQSAQTPSPVTSSAVTTPTLRPATTPAPGGTRAPTRTPTPSGPPPSLFTPAAQAATTGDAILAGAGDIACDPTDPNYNNGAGTGAACREKYTSDILVNLSQQAKIPFAVFAAGDDQYENGALANYQSSYDRTWGRVKNLTHPSIGNHEYLTHVGLGYFQYFGDLAGDPHKAYYSYDLGAWHIVVINSNCSEVGGCTLGSPQEVWLKADLAAHPTACALAYWHHPRYSSGQHGNFLSMKDIWQDLIDAKAEFVIGGHDHDYERFAPQDANGNLDTQNGMRQFIVGTGGKNHTKITTPIANSEVQNDKTYGIMKFTLHPNSYDWQFIPEAGKTFTDSGSQSCH